MYSKREREITMLRNIIIEKYRIENPGRELTADLANQIYSDLNYFYDKYGYECTKRKIESERLHYSF